MENIDTVISEIFKKDNNLTIFCGAGISIKSGIPSAIPLLKEILTQLGIEPIDIEKLIFPESSLAMPFEVFFEVFLENNNSQQILNVFNHGIPTTNHFLFLNALRKM